MNEPNGTNNSEPPNDPPSLVTTPTPSPTPDPNTDPANPPEGDPQPKEPEQKPDDSPIVEPPPVSADDLKFPEDVEVSDELRDEFLGLFNDKEKSPSERAQALVDLQIKAAREASEKASEAWSAMQTQWRDEVKADPEVGGDKLQPALGRINRLLTEYGTEELNGVMDLTGAGNNLHVVKFLDKVAKALTEGGPATGQPAQTAPSAASKMFPSMKG